MADLVKTKLDPNLLNDLLGLFEARDKGEISEDELSNSLKAYFPQIEDGLPLIEIKQEILNQIQESLSQTGSVDSQRLAEIEKAKKQAQETIREEEVSLHRKRWAEKIEKARKDWIANLKKQGLTEPQIEKTVGKIEENLQKIENVDFGDENSVDVAVRTAVSAVIDEAIEEKNTEIAQNLAKAKEQIVSKVVEPEEKPEEPVAVGDRPATAPESLSQKVSGVPQGAPEKMPVIGEPVVVPVVHRGSDSKQKNEDKSENAEKHEYRGGERVVAREENKYTPAQERMRKEHEDYAQRVAQQKTDKKVWEQERVRVAKEEREKTIEAQALERENAALEKLLEKAIGEQKTLIEKQVADQKAQVQQYYREVAKYNERLAELEAAIAISSGPTEMPEYLAPMEASIPEAPISSSEYLPQKSKFGQFFEGIKGRFSGKAKDKVAGAVGKKVAKEVAKKATAKAVGAAVGSAVAPGIGTAVGLAVGWLIENKDKILAWVKKNVMKGVMAAFGAMAMFIAGLPVGVAIGGTLGAIAGGIIGSFFGPWGTVIGIGAGGVMGGWLGSLFGGLGGSTAASAAVSSTGAAVMGGGSATGIVGGGMAATGTISTTLAIGSTAAMTWYGATATAGNFSTFVANSDVNATGTVVEVELVKRATPEIITTDPTGQTVKYQVFLTTKPGITVSSAVIKDTITVLGKKAVPTKTMTFNYTNGQTLAYEYSLTADMKDSLLLNSVTATGTWTDGKQSKAFSASTSVPVRIGNPDVAQFSCPVIGGQLTCNSQNYSGGTSCHHCDANYLKNFGQSMCNWGGNNKAIDVSSSLYAPVFAPSIKGKSVTWTLTREGGHKLYVGQKYREYKTTSDGTTYVFQVQHLIDEKIPTTIKSGEIVGHLSSFVSIDTGQVVSSPHAHIQIGTSNNGAISWIPAEEIFTSCVK